MCQFKGYTFLERVQIKKKTAQYNKAKNIYMFVLFLRQLPHLDQMLLHCFIKLLYWKGECLKFLDIKIELFPLSN